MKFLIPVLFCILAFSKMVAAEEATSSKLVQLVESQQIDAETLQAIATDEELRGTFIQLLETYEEQGSIQEVGQKCRKVGRVCTRHTQCCSGTCFLICR